MHLRSVGRIVAGEEDGSAIAALRDALRSFWRRFWNHIVTTLCSLCETKQSNKSTRAKDRKKEGGRPYRSSSRASASRSSREGWDVRWKSCSSMVSWEPVKRLRERFVVGLGVLKRRSSEEEPRLDDDSERKRLGLIEAMKRGARRSHNGFIQGCLNATRRASKPTRRALQHVTESNFVASLVAPPLT